MEVKITTKLRTALDAQDEARTPDDFETRSGADMLIEDFTDWKSGDEYGSYIFGKDSAYTTPTINGEKNVLRHVHLVPLADKVQLAQWNKAWRRQGRKTSDRALVYVDDGRGGYLLIYILDEPTAHEVARMSTVESKELMEAFAAIAEAFLDDGAVIA